MMPTEFKTFEKDLITGYAPDIHEMKRNVRERDRQLVASWHAGDLAPGLPKRKPSAELQKEIRAELRQSFNNIRGLEQKNEESPIAALFKLFKG